MIQNRIKNQSSSCEEKINTKLEKIKEIHFEHQKEINSSYCKNNLNQSQHAKKHIHASKAQHMLRTELATKASK